MRAEGAVSACVFLYVERDRADSSPSCRLLPEGCIPASEAAREAHVRYQLHGNGTSHGRTPQLPAVPWTADQGRLTAASTGGPDLRWRGTVLVLLVTGRASICGCGVDRLRWTK